MNIEQATLVAIVALIITVAGQLLYIAYMFGRFATKLENLEKRQEKHNNVIERQFKTESDVNIIDYKIWKMQLWVAIIIMRGGKYGKS